MPAGGLVVVVQPEAWDSKEGNSVAFRDLGPSNITLVAHSASGDLLWPSGLERLTMDPDMLCARVRTPSLARYNWWQL